MAPASMKHPSVESSPSCLTSTATYSQAGKANVLSDASTLGPPGPDSCLRQLNPGASEGNPRQGLVPGRSSSAPSGSKVSQASPRQCDPARLPKAASTSALLSCDLHPSAAHYSNRASEVCSGIALQDYLSASSAGATNMHLPPASSALPQPVTRCCASRNQDPQAMERSPTKPTDIAMLCGIQQQFGQPVAVSTQHCHVGILKEAAALQLTPSGNNNDNVNSSPGSLGSSQGSTNSISSIHCMTSDVQRNAASSDHGPAMLLRLSPQVRPPAPHHQLVTCNVAYQGRMSASVSNSNQGCRMMGSSDEFRCSPPEGHCKEIESSSRACQLATQGFQMLSEGTRIPRRRLPCSSTKLRLSLRHGSTAGKMAQYVRYLADAIRKRERDMRLGGWFQCTIEFEESYRVISNLGQGHFGVVKLCEEKETGLRFACKTIPKAKIQREEDVQELCAEVTTMLKLQSQPVVDSTRFVQLYEVMNSADSIHLIMEHCDGGDLFEYLASAKRLSEEEAAQILKEVVVAVKDLHALGLVHRDLKLENILLCNNFLQQDCGDSTQQRKPRPRLRAKVADFGLCVELKPGYLARGAAGSPFYMAPEVVGRNLHGKEVDSWSLGVVLYTCLSGYLPFWGKDKDSVFARVMAGQANLEKKPWPSVSDEAKGLIRGMLNPDPSSRYGMDDILAHPWFVKMSP